MLSKFKKSVKDVEKVKNEEPVSKEDIEALISLINVASETKSDFELCLKLSIGMFKVDYASFDGIKLVTKKNEEDKLLIKHKNMLLSNDTFINIKDINHIRFNLKFYDKEENDV